MNKIKELINKLLRRPTKIDSVNLDTNLCGKVIAVDFDGTLVKNKYPMIGPANLPLIRKLKELHKNNTLILWTCRAGKPLDEAVAFCKIYDLTFDYVNCNSLDILKSYNGYDSRKITADIYIDDKAMTPSKFIEVGVADYD